MIRANPKQIAIVSLLLFYLLIGLRIFADYGISWDEPNTRQNGIVSATYIKERLADFVSLLGMKIDPGNKTQVTDLHSWEDRDYGVFFELLLVKLEFFLKEKDSKDIYQTRHLLTFLTVWLSVCVFYSLTQKLFDSYFLGFLGCLFLILSPRIFADSFYNSKDLVFLAFSIFVAYSMFKFFSTPSFFAAIVHSLVTAAAVNIRVVGIYFFAITVGVLGIKMFSTRYDKRDPKQVKSTLLLGSVTYVVGTSLLTVLFWPFLWEDPIRNFLFVLKSMSHFRWDADVLFCGNFINATDVQWYYIPVWIGITTPVLYSLLFIFGMVAIGCEFAKNPGTILYGSKERDHMVVFVLFAVPLVAVIILKSVLYDAWRQMFFIYPFFILIALYGIELIQKTIQKLEGTKNKIAKVLCLSILAWSVIQTTIIMIRYHPYQNVYFNFLAGDNVDKKFDLDYWGLSYRQALEFILQNNRDKEIKVAAANWGARRSWEILGPADQKRIKFRSLNEAKYFLSNYRFQREFAKFQQNEFPYNKEIYSIKVDGYKIMGVYDLDTMSR